MAHRAKRARERIKKRKALKAAGLDPHAEAQHDARAAEPPAGEPPLPIPVHALGGDADRSVAPAGLEAWRHACAAALLPSACAAARAARAARA